MAYVRDFKELPKQMEKRAKEWDRSRQLLMRRVGREVSQAVILATPRLTGRAQRNWLLSKGRPKTTYYSRVRGSPPSVTSAALLRAYRVAANFQITKRGNSVMYISNHAPYIERLNSGTHSRKAPANFIGLAFNAAWRAVKRHKMFLGKGG
jgi:hypothetical protein